MSHNHSNHDSSDTRLGKSRLWLTQWYNYFFIYGSVGGTLLIGQPKPESVCFSGRACWDLLFLSFQFYLTLPHAWLLWLTAVYLTTAWQLMVTTAWKYMALKYIASPWAWPYCQTSFGILFSGTHSYCQFVDSLNIKLYICVNVWLRIYLIVVQKLLVVLHLQNLQVSNLSNGRRKVKN